MLPLVSPDYEHSNTNLTAATWSLLFAFLLVFLSTTAGMRAVVNFFQSPQRHVGVDLRGAEVFVTEIGLQAADVGSPVQHVRGRTVTNQMTAR